MVVRGPCTAWQQLLWRRSCAFWVFEDDDWYHSDWYNGPWTRVPRDEVPVFLLGHSLGSLIALAYLTEHSASLAGCILSAVPADIDGAPAHAIV